MRAVQSSLYMECEARVKVEEKHSEWFTATFRVVCRNIRSGLNWIMGVRHGCTISPCLFNVLLDTVANEAREGFIHGKSEIGEGECGFPTIC